MIVGLTQQPGSGLGIWPILIGGAVVAGGSVAAWEWGKSRVPDYSTPPYPARPNAPAAPITESAMRSWTPDMLTETELQRNQVARQYQQYIRDTFGGENGGMPVGDGNGEEGTSLTTWLLVGGAVVAALVLVK